MLSPLVMSSLDSFSPGTHSMPWIILREWTWHHKSNGDSRATDHRGQSRAHRKYILSPHSHCPHWCLFKLGFDTWRDFCSAQVSYNSTLAYKALKVPLSLFCRNQTDRDTESLETLPLLSAPPSRPLAVTHSVTHFLLWYQTDRLNVWLNDRHYAWFWILMNTS